MADFKGTVLTQAGRNILAKALTGAQLQFTKVQLGDGVWDESINPEDLTALVSSRIDLPINDIEITGDGTARIRVLLTNTGLTEGFFTRELGIFAKDPETGEETLYAVSYAENPDFIPSDGVTKVENIFDVYTVISNAQNVTAVISDTVVLATKQDIEEHNQDPNAHNGLINADKVDDFDASQTPTANTIPVLNPSGQLWLPFNSVPILVNGQDLMHREFYVDAENGDDNNDGSQSAPFKTLKKAIDSVPNGGAVCIYLYYDQIYEIDCDIDLNNNILVFRTTGSGTNKPKIYFRNYVSSNLNWTHQFKCRGACSIDIIDVDLEMEAQDSAYSDSVWCVAISGRFAMLVQVRISNSTIVIRGLGFLSGRDCGFASIGVSGCNIIDEKGALLHVVNGVGAVVNIDSGITNGGWVNGLIKDTNGVPRNVISNIVL
ncbi:MAG: phage tail protein [Thermodesulfobacterium sp.]|nr:phage tail protein [Thermodesulfobacterium sp.]